MLTLRRCRTHVLLAATLTISMLMTQFAQPAVAQHDAPVHIDLPGDQRVPQTDGTTVVWVDDGTGDSQNPDIYGANLADGQPFPIATNAFGASNPDVDQGTVVWAEAPECAACQTDVVGMHLASQERFVVAEGVSDDSRPAISGPWVVWQSGTETGPEIRARNIDTDAEPRTLATVGATARGPLIEGTRVVWEDAALDGDPNRWGLFTMQIGLNQPVLLYEGVTNNGVGGSRGFDIANDTVVVADGLTGKIHTYNLVDRISTIIAADSYDQSPTTDGRYVIWEHHAGQQVSLRGYDLLTDSTFDMVTSGTRHERPRIGGSYLVWSEATATDSAIQAVPVISLLPQVYREDPGQSAGLRYFPETGHALDAGFLTFWDMHGGLPVFGYPLTEAFSEHNRDVDQFVRTQYLERQRFEWHADLADTPYAVLLGRLGVELLDAQGRDWHAFPTTDPDTPHYAPETGHAIDERFYAYWSSHGLELGDQGTSFRESLALFGHPISEPMLETNVDGDTVLTQYFERAIFEWHADLAGTPYEVLLRRVGAELLDARGWDEPTAGHAH